MHLPGILQKYNLWLRNTLGPLLTDYLIGQWNVVVQDRWSLVTLSYFRMQGYSVKKVWFLMAMVLLCGVGYHLNIELPGHSAYTKGK